MRKTLLFMLSLLFILSSAQVNAAATTSVNVLKIEGVINTFSAQYLARGLQEAEQMGASLVVIELNTPGGLESSMREMVQLLLATSTPTVVFVAPQGARATSAGMFILLAADVAAMAPATHVGAAQPVALSGAAEDTMQEKMKEDAAALVRSIAGKRGRNAQWAESAVKENQAVTSAEALQLGVIDILAEDLDDLLRQIQAKKLVDIGEDLNAFRFADIPMNAVERIFHILTEPNIAYMLLSLGMLLLLAELADPGLSIAGIGAGLAFILALLGFGSLPVNWAGVALLGLAVIIFLAGLLTETEFAVSFAGLVPFVLGSMLLFRPLRASSPAAPSLQVSPWLIAIMAIAILGFSFFVLRAVLAATRTPPRSGAERLIGLQGTALTALCPNGQVRVELEEWSAAAVEGEISKGAMVKVVGVRGVRLQVSALPADEKPARRKPGKTNPKRE